MQSMQPYYAYVPFGSVGYAVSVALIGIMLSISGIILGIGFALNSKKLKEVGKQELGQSVLNGILVGSLLMLFAGNGVVSSLINTLTLQNGTSISCTGMLTGNIAICFAYNYLVGPSAYTFMGTSNMSVLSLATYLLMVVYALYAVLGIFSTFLGPMLGQLRYISQALSAIAVSATVQASILAFVAVSALTLIMPLGIILRTFYPTRKLGGLLIALAIGLYVVLPLSYVFDAMVEHSFSQAYAYNYTQIQVSAKSLQSSILSSNTILSSNITGILNVGILGSVASFITSLLSSIANIVNMLLNEIAYLIVYAFIMPIFSALITIVSIRELAELLGSDASILSRLNLV